ncbi:hypothetical protein [Fulvivirga imtechensis]|nr:hypothetical protein [Fulvivirga imtechensis]
MTKLNRSIVHRGYVFYIDVSMTDPNSGDGPYTAFVRVNRKRALRLIEVAGLNVRDDRGKRKLFDTVEDAFEEAEEFIKGFNISVST